MSTPPRRRHAQHHRTVGAQARLLLVLPVVDLLFIVGVFVYLGDQSLDASSLGLLVYNLLSPVALGALIVLTAGVWPRGMPATTATCVLFSGLLIVAMLDMFTSSTGVLLLLFLPLAFLLALSPFAALGVVVHRLRGR